MKVNLVQVAWAATRTKNTYLGAKYQKLAARIGKKKALIAIARKILVSVYHMLKNKVPYVELGKEYLNNLNRVKKIKYHTKMLEELGYEVTVN